MGFIYRITNKTNGKVYIGACIGKVQARWNRHVYSARHEDTNQAVHKAIRKYGEDQFLLETIYEDSDDLFLFEFAEPFFIQLYNSHTTGHGYNQTLGGDGWLGLRHSKESKAKISRANTGRVKSPETLQKLSRAAKGKPTWNKGKICPEISMSKTGILHTTQSKANMSLSHIGASKSQECKNKISDALAEKFQLQEPTGDVIEGVNLRQYCISHGLSHGWFTASGKTKGYKLLKTIKKIRTYRVQNLTTQEIHETQNLAEFCKSQSISNAGLLSKFRKNKPYLNYQILEINITEQEKIY